MIHRIRWRSSVSPIQTVFEPSGFSRSAWSTGMKLVAFGVVDAIVGAVLELAGAIAGVVDSLNLAAAATVVLYEADRQRRASRP